MKKLLLTAVLVGVFASPAFAIEVHFKNGDVRSFPNASELEIESKWFPAKTYLILTDKNGRLVLATDMKDVLYVS